ncbi:MAG: hypothetical protein E4H03_12795 [Myxococcales bacterium]|nr:MAG: hypothetical protein E4H03_12795 [Myxococcales bacterium]
MAWAATLLTDLIGRWSKRNRDFVGQYDHERIDRDELVRLFGRYGSDRLNARLDELDDALWPFSDPGGPANSLDEFERSGVESADDIVEVFRDRFFFGCEADDPSNATAFDTRRNPNGIRLNAVFSSDVGHWDVPDNRGVLAEAWELVEDGLITEADFRDFTFSNPVGLYSATNPDFFRGTVVEEAAGRIRR